MSQDVRNEGAPPRPELAFRVGITGARRLESRPAAEIRSEVVKVLHAITDQIDFIVNANRRTKDSYSPDTPWHRSRLTLVSPLAEGADRIAAEAALEVGCSLRGVLPFPQSAYENDFASEESKKTFRELLERANAGIIELDGARGDNGKTSFGREDYEAASYENAGQLIARNCDLMIAVWDGEEGRGRGGTEAIVRYTMALGIPVWWIHAKEHQDARFLFGTNDLAEPERVKDGGTALGAYLRRLLEPPDPGESHSMTALEYLRQVGEKLHSSPERIYFDARPIPTRAIWQLHNALIRWLSGLRTRRTTDDPIGDTYWFRLFLPADRLASEYGGRVRSGYVWVSLLTFLSVTLAALGPTLLRVRASMNMAGDAMEVLPTSLELLLLVAISVIMLRRQWHEWQQRWRDYRRLAEFFRAQQVLAPLCEGHLGWIRTVADLDFPTPVGRSLWVTWLYSAALRGAPWRSLRLYGASLEEQRRQILEIVAQQLRYHETSRELAQHAERRFRQVDELSFPIVFCLVAVKLVGLLSHWEPTVDELLSLAATVLPVLALNVASIRAATRLQLQADRSETMAQHMQRAAVRLHTVDLRLPLAVRELSTIAHGIANAMLQDIEGRFEVIDAD
ncbi:MAG TPA: hypothetical protein VGG99_19075 [Acetobacteraceae bacterium]|jgi:hypothetical protein